MKTGWNRRRFLGQVGAVASLASAMPSRFAAPSTVKAAGPLIIDTHTHFYDPTRNQGVPWPPKDDALLYRKVLPPDYETLPKPAAVAGTVVVEASAWVEDNHWILDLAASHPFIVGFVGNLPVGAPEFPDLVKRFAANPIFRGIRLGGGAVLKGLGNPTYLSHLKLLAERNLSLDLLGGAEILEAATKLGALIPDLHIVLDHLAGLRIDGRATPSDWNAALKSAARHPKVNCKVSGLVEGTGRTDGSAPRDATFYKPALDVVWESFGENRLIYGSNWPVSERFATCATVQQIVMDYFATKGAGATAKCLSGNARRVYQWIDRKGR